MRIAAVLTLFLLLLGSTGFAQQTTCTVPVTVVAPALSERPKFVLDLTSTPQSRDLPWMKPFLVDSLSAQVDAVPVPVTNLGADAFVVQEQGQPVPIRSVTTAVGPRRIVFVAENGKEMPAPAREIEAAVITDILAKARQEDSFALLTARGPRVALGFGSSREAIGTAAEGLANEPHGGLDGESSLAAVMEATTWLEPSQPGDTIYLLVLRLDKRFDISFAKVRDVVASSRVRVVGFQLGLRFAIGESTGGAMIPDYTFNRMTLGDPV